MNHIKGRVLLGIALAAAGLSTVMSVPAFADEPGVIETPGGVEVPGVVDPSRDPGQGKDLPDDREARKDPRSSKGAQAPKEIAPSAPAPDAKKAAVVLPPLSTPRTVGGVVTEFGPHGFVRMKDSKIYRRELHVAPATFYWNEPTGPVASGPSVSVAPNQRDVVHQGSVDASGAAVHSTSDNASMDKWTNWTSKGGKFTSAVALVENGEGGPVTFGRGTDGAIYALYAGGSVRLGGTAASPPSVTINDSAGVAVTVRGTDGRLYRATGDIDGQYSAFKPLGTAKVSSSASVSTRGKRYYYRGEDGALWYLDTARAGAPAVRVGGGITSTPFALDQQVEGQPERAWILARGTDGHFYAYDNGTGAWRNYGGDLA